MAKFVSGQSGNPAGRKKGASNLVGKPIKEQLSDFLNKKILELPDIWDKLASRDRASFLKDLWPYFMPKLSDVKLDFDIKKLSDEQLTELIERLFKTKK